MNTPLRPSRVDVDASSDWRRVDPPRRPVLFINPKSGGGKAAQAGLAERARKRGIEAVVLAEDQNLVSAAREAAAGGADALGMAGGDGSLAAVAATAAAYELPFVCVPAGTRNHFALDVGVDRHDLIGALDAFTDGVERRIDLAEVNGRAFVNNVSLGIYGDAVRRSAYRDAKVRTVLETADEVMGPRRGATCSAPRRRPGTRAPSSCHRSCVQQPLRTGSSAGSRYPPGARHRSISGSLLLDVPGETHRSLGRTWTAPRLEMTAAEVGACRSRRRGDGPQLTAAVRYPPPGAAGTDLLAPPRDVAIGAPSRSTSREDESTWVLRTRLFGGRPSWHAEGGDGSSVQRGLRGAARALCLQSPHRVSLVGALAAFRPP